MSQNIDSRPLVEAPMESPLNLAHSFSRRADMLTKNKKYEEAISCHRKAAEFLLQAMKSSTSSCPAVLLESMSLQHKAYLSEISRLHAKNQLLELMDRNDKSSATISQATQTDYIHSMDTTGQTPFDENEIYQVLRENDDVMNRLALKNKEKMEECNKDCDDKIVHENNPSDGSLPSEVLKVNEKLSEAVRCLLQELGSTRAEKKQMEEKLSESQEVLKQGTDGELKFYSLDLPPLEVSYPELAMLKMET